MSVNKNGTESLCESQPGLVVERRPLHMTGRRRIWCRIKAEAKAGLMNSGVCFRKDFPLFLGDLVNTIIANSPTSKVLFNTGVDDTFSTAQRAFADL